MVIFAKLKSHIFPLFIFHNKGVIPQIFRYYLVSRVVDILLWCLICRRLVKSDAFCETPENPDFLRKDKMVISVKIRNFSISRMTKRTSPLESSREI